MSAYLSIKIPLPLFLAAGCLLRAVSSTPLLALLQLLFWYIHLPYNHKSFIIFLAYCCIASFSFLPHKQVNMVIGILVFNKLVSKDGITDVKLKERAG